MITRSKAKQQNIQDQQNLTKENNQKTNQQPGNQNNQQTGQTSRGNNQQQPALNPVKTNNKERTDHAGIPTIGEISKCLICCHRSDLFGLGECMHPICMKCSLRIRVFGEKKQCPQCQTDIPILYYVSAPQGQKHLLKLPTNCIDHVEYEAKFSVRFDSKYALECFDSFLDKRRKECVERLNEWVFFDPTKKSKTSIIHGQFKYIFRKNGIWRCSKNPIKVYKCNAYLREFQKNYILCADHTCDLVSFLWYKSYSYIKNVGEIFLFF
ncbi:unnamed protein product [Meloidogyne enterolobii]|uniref:Uncharacterized protein n=1 Tax=Meloidogyne enterolobii TaxID=390850 RepID=A0ACB0YG59_MELEN